jgi:hypothetical protein
MKLGYRGHLNRRNKFPNSNPQKISLPILKELEKPR